jgi:hypothetical protein
MTQLKIEMKVTPSFKLAPLPTENKTDQLSAKIRKITFDGFVFIEFNSTMKVPSHPEELENTTVFIDKKTYPALDVKIIPGVQSKISNLQFNWTFKNFTQTELVLKMNFKTPEWVSINEYKEQIEITIYANHFFSDIRGVFIPQGFVLSRKPIVQISAPDKAMVENLGS